MRDDFAHPGIEGDFQDLAVVFQIDTAGRLEPEIVRGAGFGDGFEFGAVLQAAHREVFDGAAAHVFQQRDGGFQRHNAIRRAAAQRAGGDLHHSRRTGGRDQAVDHRLVLPEQRAAGSHAGEDLVDVLRLHLARNLAHHRRLIRIPRAQPDGEGVINQLRVVAHIGHRAGDVRIVFGEHADQDVTFRRVVNFTGVVFAARQDVQAHAVTVKVWGQFHACFSLFRTSAMRRATTASCSAFTLRTSASIMPSFAL